MASIARLVVSLGASTAQFERDLKKAGGISKREMARMERQAKQLNDKWNRNFRMAGLAVAGGLALATRAALDFEKAMGEVATLGAGNIDKLGDSVKKMSVEFGQAPVEQAKALYQIISAGASTASEQIELLTASNKLAVGGITDVETAADGLTSILNAYAGQGMSAANVSDILFTTMKQGKTTIGELSQSIGNVATIASQTGVDFAELGAAIGTLTKSGIDTSRAIDGIRGVLSAVLKQSPAAVQAAKDMGVEFNIAAIESQGFAGWLKSISENEKVTSEGLAKMFGRVEALSSVMALGAGEMAEFTAQLEAQADAAGATEEAFATMADRTAFKVAQASAAFETLKIQIGEKFLASVSNMAVAFVKHIDAISASVKILVQLLAVRLGVAAVAGILAATTATGGLATAMAFLGGPIGAVVLAVGGLLFALDQLYEKRLRELDFVKIQTGLIIKQAEAYIRLGAAVSDAFKASLQVKYDAILEQLTLVGKKIQVVQAELDKGNTIYSGMKGRMEELRLEANNLSNVLGRHAKALIGIKTAADIAEPPVKDLADEVGNLAKELEQLSKITVTAERRMLTWNSAMIKAFPRIRAARDMIEESWQELEEFNKQAAIAANDSMQGLIDQLYPLETAQREFNDQLAMLAPMYDGTAAGAARYADAVQRLGQAHMGAIAGIKGTVKEFDFMATAIDEGVRILERSFQSMWESLLDGSKDVFDSVLDGFKSLLANLIHQATTQKILLNVQQGLAPGGPGINTGALLGDLAKFGGVILGSLFGGGGEYATIGSTIGFIAGEALVSALSGTWLALGSIGGPIGVAIVAVLGGLFGGLFDKDRPAVLQVSSFDTTGLSKSDDDALISTLFGDTFLRSRRIDSAAIGEIGQAIEDFDNAFSFLDPAQINSITEALAGWGQQMEGEAINIEQLLTSRFRTILSTFADDIQAFVNQGEDLAAQMDRLQVSFAAQDILDAAPDLFSGRTLTEFLSVVSGFAEGMGSITDGFNEVVRLVNLVGSVLTSLKDFAGSDLTADYNALLAGDVSLTEALAGMNAGLMDAVANFDGSIESLQQIGAIAMTIREGELKLLAQIDGVMQGLNASLDKLKADILAVGQPAATGEEIFNSAAALINTVAAARTPEEVAQIGQQFEALIRSLSEADQLSNQSELARMIEVFRGAANDTLAAQRQEVIDNATETRNMLDGFLTRIGDTLDIIAGSNQAAADSLAIIAGENTGFNEGSEAVDDALFEKGEGRKERDRGIEKAIRQGFKGVNMNVILPGGGLVNE